MSRATYTDADKARVYVVLAANEGNVKRTARETSVPENTVRRWRDDWATNGPPSVEEVETAVEDFVSTATEVRNEALLEIRRQIKAGEMKGAALVTAFGVLTDKIDRAKGLALGKVEHTVTLPSPDEIREALAGVFAGALQAAQQRQEEIIDAEVVDEQAALPSGS